MAGELKLVDADVITAEERSELDAAIDAIINSHKANRQEINRLAFESVAAMTDADEAQTKLANKGFFSRMWGGISGSNKKLQDKINSSRAVAQYAGQQTLQKLAEQNLLTFDLITAVNNKLNASLTAVDDEFKNIYDGLGRFLKQNRTELVKIENRLEKIERNVNLLTWQNSVEYQDFRGMEYADLGETEKIVCLASDFMEITKGEWSTSDLLLLKTAMASVNISPKDKINYLETIKEIAEDSELRGKLFGGMSVSSLPGAPYLLISAALQKFEKLENEEKYIVNTVADCLGDTADSVEIEEKLTKKYMEAEMGADVNVEAEAYDFILDLLVNVHQCQIGEDTVKDYGDRDISWLLKAAKNGDLDAANELGDRYSEGEGVSEDNEEAVKWYRLAAEQGHAKGQCNLGEMYCWGCGVEENNEEALKWYRKAAEQGDVDGQFSLGWMYYNGYGVPEDNEEAVKWYRLAAEQGHANGQDWLGFMYKNGYGVSQDDEEAVKWYRKAAEQGYEHAQYNLGVMYANGRGVAQDDAEAVKWYRKAAERGYADGQANLGWMYWRGRGVEQDNAEAVTWYRLAAEQGHATGQNNLGFMYENGYGIDQNYKEAVKWYRMAAEQGNERSQYHLGVMYEDGKGVELDEQEAKNWYQKAADNGDADAKCRLERIIEKEQEENTDDDSVVQTLETVNKMLALGLKYLEKKGY